MSKNIQKLYNDANTLAQSGDVAGAAEVFARICKLDKKNYDNWFNYGMLSGNVGDLASAEKAFRNALSLNKSDPRAIQMLAKVYESQQRYSDAIKMLARLYEAQPTDELAYNLGNLSGMAEDFEGAITWFTRFSGHMNDAHACHCLASSYESMEDYERSDTFYRRAIELQPAAHSLINNYGAMLHKSSRFDEAIAAYRRSILLDSNFYKSHFNLATTLHATGQFIEAKEHFKIALGMEPNSCEALTGLGKSHRALADIDDAIACYLRSIEIDPTFMDAYSNLGLSYMTEGKYSEAREALETARKIDPDNIETRCAIARLHERDSNYEEAFDCISDLITSIPAHPDIATAYGAICRKIDRIDEGAEYLRATVDNPNVANLARSRVLFLLGKLYDDTKRYDEAFDAYRRANTVLPFNYDKTESLQAMMSLKNIYIAMKDVDDFVSDSEAEPIFIVGMPRSGTSLTEQIIASHHSVSGGGELPCMTDAANRIREILTDGGKTLDFGNISHGDMNTIADGYMSCAMEDKPSGDRISDKMPHNFQYLGLIELLFPRAKVININRNPIDNCLSIYFSDFNFLHPYSGDLDKTAMYYKEVYMDLIRFWKNNLSMEIYDLQYEDLVNDQENQTRKLLEFCGLEWDDNCLQFHKNKRSVATISYDQVKQPIYTKSQERWKNYQQHLDALKHHFPQYAG